MATQPTLEIDCDTAPMRSFLALLAAFATERGLKLGELPRELGRFETDDRATRAGKLRVVLYPSDAFLRFAAALVARKGKGLTVE